MTKKILISGMNSLQSNRDFFLKQQLKVAPSHYALVRCLEDMGYEVEQRIVELGEDISHYDDVILYMHTPQAFCQNLYNGLYTFAARPDCIIAFDDWQVKQIYGGVQKFKDELTAGPNVAYRNYFLELQQRKHSKEELEKYTEKFHEACDIILRKNNRLLVSAFAGGDVSLLNLGWKSDKIVTFNPNPYHYNRTSDNNFYSNKNSLFTDISPEDKKRVWNFSSLVQAKTKKWLKDLETQWPIIYYGSRRAIDKQERLTEDEMCRVYSQQWGCLMSSYEHKSSGWWRARPLQIADCGSILIGDKAELNVLYRDDKLSNLRPIDIESMDLEQLILIAAAQKEALYSTHPLDKNITKKELNSILELSR